MANSSSSSSGIGFCGLLTVLFIGLKLTGFISWSWWLVLAPLWLPAAVAFCLLIILGGFWLRKEIRNGTPWR